MGSEFFLLICGLHGRGRVCSAIAGVMWLLQFKLAAS
jgi:hypothetical protein